MKYFNPYIESSKIAHVCVTAMFFVITIVLAQILITPTVHAQDAKPTKQMKNSYAKLCTELKKINTSNAKSDYNKYCKKKPTTLNKMNSAVDDVCKSYGNNRLEKQCDDYQSIKTDNSSPLVSSNIKGDATHQCGKGDNAVDTKFDFGCVGDDYDGDTLNPILDVLYAIIRFLSLGVGIVIVGSIIWAGIQYSSSQGNPEQTQAAKSRIQNAITGLVLYMFIYALIQYLVPGGLFT